MNLAPARAAFGSSRSRTSCAPTALNTPSRRAKPHWSAGDEGCGEFFTYLLVNPSGEWYAGQTRDLRVRLWEHRHDGCKSTAAGDYRLAWFEQHPSRSAAADRELELKRRIDQDRYGVIRMALDFQERIGLVRPLETAG